jgi:hypothetical protein
VRRKKIGVAEVRKEKGIRGGGEEEEEAEEEEEEEDNILTAVGLLIALFHSLSLVTKTNLLSRQDEKIIFSLQNVEKGCDVGQY